MMILLLRLLIIMFFYICNVIQNMMKKVKMAIFFVIDQLSWSIKFVELSMVFLNCGGDHQPVLLNIQHNNNVENT